MSKFNAFVSTSNAHVRDRLTYGQDEASRAYVAHEFSSSLGRSFSGSIPAGTLDNLTLSLFTSDACTVQRTQYCLRQDTDEVCTQIAGGMTIHQVSQECELAVNDLVLISQGDHSPSA